MDVRTSGNVLIKNKTGNTADYFRLLSKWDFPTAINNPNPIILRRQSSSFWSCLRRHLRTSTPHSPSKDRRQSYPPTPHPLPSIESPSRPEKAPEHWLGLF